MDEAFIREPEEFSDPGSLSDMEEDGREGFSPLEYRENFNMELDGAESHFSEESVDSDSSSSGHYESISSMDTDQVYSGRWIESKELEGLVIPCIDDADSAVSSFAEFASLLTSCLDRFARNLEGRFFAENEYSRLDEISLCEVFALSVCSTLAEGRGGDVETTHLQFFKMQWTRSMRNLSENLRSETFSQLTFEAAHNLKWIGHNDHRLKGSDPEDHFD